MAKLPSFQFYPGDWMKDPALRACSIAARGLWTDMLCLMFESVRRGYLQHATGKPVTAEQLARMTGCSADEVSRLLQELEDSGVFSRTEHGVIYSRRMSRDESKREKCREAGKRGGNPTLNRQSKGRDKGTDKGRSNRKPTPSSSTSSSPSGSEESPSDDSSGPNGQSNPPKPRNLLFDAVADVSGYDPKTAGDTIGTAVAKIAKGDPPYTPDDIREFGRRFWEICPWASEGSSPRTRPTPHEIAKNIGLIRAGPGQVNHASGNGHTKPSQDQLTAQMAAKYGSAAKGGAS